MKKKNVKSHFEEVLSGKDDRENHYHWFGTIIEIATPFRGMDKAEGLAMTKEQYFTKRV